MQQAEKDPIFGVEERAAEARAHEEKKGAGKIEAPVAAAGAANASIIFNKELDSNKARPLVQNSNKWLIRNSATLPEYCFTITAWDHTEKSSINWRLALTGDNWISIKGSNKAQAEIEIKPHLDRIAAVGNTIPKVALDNLLTTIDDLEPDTGGKRKLQRNDIIMPSGPQALPLQVVSDNPNAPSDYSALSQDAYAKFTLANIPRQQAGAGAGGAGPSGVSNAGPAVPSRGANLPRTAGPGAPVNLNPLVEEKKNQVRAGLFTDPHAGGAAPVASAAVNDLMALLTKTLVNYNERKRVNLKYGMEEPELKADAMEYILKQLKNHNDFAKLFGRLDDKQIMRLATFYRNNNVDALHAEKIYPAILINLLKHSNTTEKLIDELKAYVRPAVQAAPVAFGGAAPAVRAPVGLFESKAAEAKGAISEDDKRLIVHFLNSIHAPFGDRSWGLLVAR